MEGREGEAAARGRERRGQERERRKLSRELIM